MAITTLFELATQHGEIAAHMSKYITRQRHTYDIIREQNGLGDRVYRVFADDRPEPIFQYRIPERTSTETARMWVHQVQEELDREWAKQVTAPAAAKKEAALAAAAPPAPALSDLSSPASGPDGTLPDSPSISSSPTSSSTPTSSDPVESNSAAAVPAPGASDPSPPPSTSKTSSPTITGTSKRASKRTGS